MHYASHILLFCIALWCATSGGEAARSSVSPDILANFAKNVASVLSPAILGDVQSRNNRSSFQSIPTVVSANLNGDDLNSHSILDNIVDKTSNEATFYQPRPNPYNGLYDDSPDELEGAEATERLDGSLRDDSYQESPNFYRPYDFTTSSDNLDVTPKAGDNIESSIGNIQESPTSLYPSYHGGGFHKAAFPHGPFLDKPYGGFHGFHGPYGHYHHHHHSYGDGSSEEASSGENNGTNHRGYGSPYFDSPYSPFPYGRGYGHRDYGPYPRNGNDSSGNGRDGHYGYGPYGGPDFYGPYPRNGNDSYGDGRDGHYGYGPYGGPDFYGPYHRNGNDSYGGGRDGHYGYGPYGGPDFYGPPGYGYNHGYNNGNNNGNSNDNNNNRQTEEPAENGDQNNSTKNGYSPPYGPPWVKPLLGTFHLHGYPSPFNLLPYDHFHGVFKGGPVVGVGPVGYPIYADPYLAGFPFHPYGPFFHGKKYLPPKGKPADSGETTMAPAELMESENPERITALNEEEIAPAPSSNRYTTSGRKKSKRINLVNFESRRV